MATCRYCGSRMDWGQEGEKWVKLIPIGEDVGLDRTHQDENGVLRARHTCVGWTPAVKVVQLATPISAGDIIGQAVVELSTEKPKRKHTRRVKAGEMTVPLKIIGRRSKK